MILAPAWCFNPGRFEAAVQFCLDRAKTVPPPSLHEFYEIARPFGMHQGATFVELVGHVERESENYVSE